ncbi:SLC13 family permease [Dolosicoccus paucivorans]|uniref:SLC13 family permease n=1 Tax=Dolosicoccus paucivorans TaxID=84521 RepID=UPI00215574FD|nr:SLC13 family permease [Dolosicoccus paucivorans]
MEQILVIIAIVLSIGIGYVKKINVGLVAISFAYFIGVFILKLSPGEVIGFWPTNLFFTILSVLLFYNIAISNGTLNYLAEWTLYKTRHHQQAIYLILYSMSVLIAAAGAGFFSTMAICGPIAVSLAKRNHRNVLLAAQAVNLGASGGANFVTSGSGVVFQGLFKELGLENYALSYGHSIFLFTIIYPFILIMILYIIDHLSSSKTQEESSLIQPPQHLTQKQKQTLVLMGLMMGIVLVLPNLSLVFPNNLALNEFSKVADIGLICIVLTVVGFWLNLAAQQEVFSHLPWNTLIMLSGMGMLIKLATQVGLIETVAQLMSTSIPTLLLPVTFVVVAGVLSLFSSTLSVVTPTLFPIVTAMLAAKPELNAQLLFIAVVVGSLSTNISPFSSAGSLIQASIPDAFTRDPVFKQQLVLGVPMMLTIAVISVFILSLFI